jgi:ABC-type Co2+ transport system permease subunit
MNLIPENYHAEKRVLLWIITFLIIFVALGLWWSVQLNSREKKRKVNILIGLITALIVVSMALAIILFV